MGRGRELDWWLLDHLEHRGVHDLVGDLNRRTAPPPLWARDDPAGLHLDRRQRRHQQRVLLPPPRHRGRRRRLRRQLLRVPHHDYRLGLPAAGAWTEILNTDAEIYYGSGVGNLGAVTAVADPSLAETPGGSPAYAEIVVPPLATVWFRRDK